MYTYTEIKRTSLLDFSDCQLLGRFKTEILKFGGVPVWLGPSGLSLNLPVGLPCTGGDPHSLASSGVDYLSGTKQGWDRSIRGMVLDFTHWITNPGTRSQRTLWVEPRNWFFNQGSICTKGSLRGLWVCCLLLGLSRSDLLQKVPVLPCLVNLPCSFLC